MGINPQLLMANLDEINETNITKNFKSVPINKIREYCEVEDQNSTLLVKYAGHTSLAILDSATGVAIATKEM